MQTSCLRACGQKPILACMACLLSLKQEQMYPGHSMSSSYASFSMSTKHNVDVKLLVWQ